MKANHLLGGCVVLMALLGCGTGSEEAAQDAESVGEGGPLAPLFEVDPFWPKPLPNHMILGASIGVAVDSRDHVWIVQRNTPEQFGSFNEIGAAQDPHGAVDLPGLEWKILVGSQEFRRLGPTPSI